MTAAVSPSSLPQSSTGRFEVMSVADATGQRDHAVVGEDVAVERIQRRVVDVGREHALAEIVEVMCPPVLCGRSPPSHGRARSSR